MVSEKIKKIKFLRLKEDERYFYNLIQGIKIKKPFFWSKTFVYSVDGKCIFQINNSNKTIHVLYDIYEYYEKTCLISETDIKIFLLKMIKNYFGIENYDIIYFV